MNVQVELNDELNQMLLDCKAAVDMNPSDIISEALDDWFSKYLLRDGEEV